MGLIEEGMAIILEINSHKMILHTQGKGWQVASPHLEEYILLKAL